MWGIHKNKKKHTIKKKNLKGKKTQPGLGQAHLGHYAA
jgi:hypothetical protein